MSAAVLVLLFALLWTVYRTARRVWQTYQCPPNEVIRAFWRGKLRQRTEEYQHFIAHLGHCEACRERLHRLEKGLPIEDHLVE
jgi:hypothetical protein